LTLTAEAIKKFKYIKDRRPIKPQGNKYRWEDVKNAAEYYELNGRLTKAGEYSRERINLSRNATNTSLGAWNSFIDKSEKDYPVSSRKINRCRSQDRINVFINPCSVIIYLYIIL
jgi:hypothetical protein